MRHVKTLIYWIGTTENKKVLQSNERKNWFINLLHLLLSSLKVKFKSIQWKWVKINSILIILFNFFLTTLSQTINWQIVWVLKTIKFSVLIRKMNTKQNSALVWKIKNQIEMTIWLEVIVKKKRRFEGGTLF
jgi:hypothetical protein